VTPGIRAAIASSVLSLFLFWPVQAQQLTGRWQARIVSDSLTLTFPLELSGDSVQPVVSFFNGTERVSSTGARWQGDSLIVSFEHLASELRAVIDKGVLRGSYGNTRRAARRIIEARRESANTKAADSAPVIDGLWYLPHNSPKGEKAWRFVVQQTGARATATILRVDGDAGAHVGEFAAGRFLLNHFDGARASQIEVVPAADSILVYLRNGRSATRVFTGHRPEAARARGLPEPADFATHTGVKDPDEPFQFSFPDLAGRLVSNTDARFAGKVVLVNIGGSWCPNCHDEAPFLAELDRTYRARGLEIVMLDFEEADELARPQRLPAFIRRHGVEYTVLLAGNTDELTAKIPQATNLNSWPTTFFLGRDGTVRAVHAGFAAKASGTFHEQLRKEYISTIERLLAEGGRAGKD
jgi:thiol-disulfide isomerase/thioredoxin